LKNHFVVGVSVCLFLSLSVHASEVDSLDTYLGRAQNFQKERRWKDAENYYLKALELAPKNYQVLEGLSSYYLELNRLPEAKQTLEKMHALRNDNLATLKELARLSFNLKKYPDAVTYYTELSKVSPSEEVDIKLGTAYTEMEEYGKAITAFEGAVQKNPTNAESVYNLGRSYAETDNIKKALPYYERALALKPAKVNWVFEIVSMLNALGDPATGAKYMENASAAGMPRDLIYLENLGVLLIRTDDFERGISMFEEVLVKKPNSPKLLTYIADTYYQHQKYNKAAVAYEKLFQADTTNFQAMYMEGKAYEKMGKFQLGHDLCDKAIQMDKSLQKLKTEKFSL